MRPLVVLALALSAAACGSGTAALVGSSSSSAGGDVNSPPSATDPSAFGTTTSPALVCFDLADAESDPVDVRLRFEVLPSGPSGDCLLVAGTFENEDGDAVTVDTNLTGLATDPVGLDTPKAWDFATQLGTSRLEAVKLFVEVVGGGGSSAAPINGESDLPFAIGNDPPVVRSIDVQDDDEIVPVALVIENSGPDEQLRVKIEYVMQSAPFCGPQLARPVDPFADPLDPTPEFVIDTDTAPEGEGEVTPPLTAEETFFWESDFPFSDPDAGCSLEFYSGSVVLQVTVEEVLADPDGGALSTVAMSAPFQIDNVTTLVLADPGRDELALWSGERWKLLPRPATFGTPGTAFGTATFVDHDGDGDQDLVDASLSPLPRVWLQSEPGLFVLQ